jgi:hypothetical protein
MTSDLNSVQNSCANLITANILKYFDHDCRNQCMVLTSKQAWQLMVQHETRIVFRTEVFLIQFLFQWNTVIVANKYYYYQNTEPT